VKFVCLFLQDKCLKNFTKIGKGKVYMGRKGEEEGVSRIKWQK